MGHYDDVLAGHFGVKKTTELMSCKFFWDGMTKDIKKYISLYNICQQVKTLRHRPYGKMQALLQPSGP